jgi:hypothetical protein
MAFRLPVRRLATVARPRSSLKIGLIPADGIGREVIPVCVFCGFSLECLLIFNGRRRLQELPLLHWARTFQNQSSSIFWQVLSFLLEREPLYQMKQSGTSLNRLFEETAH